MTDSVTHESTGDISRQCAYRGCKREPYCRLRNDTYCLLHCPDEAKAAEFESAIQEKLEQADYDFSGCWFPEKAKFENIHFKGNVKFRDAIFVKGANFSGSRFDG